MTHCNVSYRYFSQGFSLLEVLITLLILAIGMLGFASLQMASVNNNLEAHFQTQATIIAKDLASRMHINRDYLNWDDRAPRSGDFAGATTALGGLGDQNVYVNEVLIDGHVCDDEDQPDQRNGLIEAKVCSARGPANPLDPATSNACDQQEMAQFDVWEACRTADDLLPEGLVHVRCQNKASMFIAGVENPRSIPYDATHKYYEPDFADPDRVLTGPYNDACSPGSHYTVYVSWLRSATRQDSGEEDLIANAAATNRCLVDLGFDADDGRDCVAMDLIP